MTVGPESPEAALEPGLQDRLAVLSLEAKLQTELQTQRRENEQVAEKLRQVGEAVRRRAEPVDGSAPTTPEAALHNLDHDRAVLKKAATTPTERATIEVVALLFQAILMEERLPAGIRVWFARLQMPVLRVPDECAYYKEDAGKMLLGAFEPVAKPWAVNGIPEDFEFDQLPEDFDHFEPILENAINRMPMLGEAGIHTFFNGPESFTPDDAYHLGEAPNLRGYFVAAGFNSVGIQSSGGAGMALAHWMEHGYPPFDISDVDIRRMQPFV